MARIRITPAHGESYEQKGTLVERSEPQKEPRYHINGKSYPADLVTILEGKAVLAWQ